MGSMGLEHRIIWHQLNCSDLDAAAEFYGELFGWTTRPEERETYSHFYMGEETVAGMMPPHGGASPGRAQWAMHLGTEGIEALTQKVQAAGGALLTGIMEIEHTGKLCAVADPTGATWMAFQPADARRSGWGNRRQTGYFCWSELLTQDPNSSVDFYGAALGFGVQERPVAGESYHLLYPPEKTAQHAVCGVMAAHQGAAGSHWHSYVLVADLDGRLELACARGAKVVAGPGQLPDGSRFAVFIDPQGAVLGLLQG